jgi:hypothetical protein
LTQLLNDCTLPLNFRRTAPQNCDTSSHAGQAGI